MNGIRRALLPVLLVAAALTCAFALQRSLACPIPAPPQPLRTLYKLSERVVVARVGAKEVLTTEDEIASVRITLHVTENVKGTPVQVIHYYRNELVRKDEEKDEEQEQAISFSSGRPVPRLKRGERYLFFLDPREEGGGYEVNDDDYAIKKLSDEALKVYLERMKELDDITRQEPEDKHAIVEWLVRCAEEPATRWEGAYELHESAEAIARGDEAETEEEGETEAAQAQAGAEAPNTSAGSEAQTAPEPQASDDSGAALSPEAAQEEVPINKLPWVRGYRYTPPDPTLMPMLNAVQKQRLSDAFVTTSEPVEGDDLLVQIVKDFGDARFPGFVLARLHRFEDEAPMEAELWVSALAASLKNAQIKELADSYIEDTSYYADDESEATATTNDAANNEAAASEEAEETPVDQEAVAARVQAAAERATRKRAAMLKALLARIDLFVTTGQLASN
jgi:hypothetical protein